MNNKTIVAHGSHFYDLKNYADIGPQRTNFANTFRTHKTGYVSATPCSDRVVQMTEKICENRNSIWVKYQSLLLARLAAIIQNVMVDTCILVECFVERSFHLIEEH